MRVFKGGRRKEEDKSNTRPIVVKTCVTPHGVSGIYAFVSDATGAEPLVALLILNKISLQYFNLSTSFWLNLTCSGATPTVPRGSAYLSDAAMTSLRGHRVRW